MAEFLICLWMWLGAFGWLRFVRAAPPRGEKVIWIAHGCMLIGFIVFGPLAWAFSEWAAWHVKQ